MTDITATAIIASVAPTLAAIGTLIVSIRNTIKSTDIAKKADEIHVLVNSNMTSVKADLTAALERVKRLEDLVVSLTEKKK